MAKVFTKANILIVIDAQASTSEHSIRAICTDGIDETSNKLYELSPSDNETIGAYKARVKAYVESREGIQ